MIGLLVHKEERPERQKGERFELLFTRFIVCRHSREGQGAGEFLL